MKVMPGAQGFTGLGARECMGRGEGLQGRGARLGPGVHGGQSGSAGASLRE